MSTVVGTLDGTGVYGTFFTYGMMFALLGSAALVFVYLWSKGRLDMHEGPKYQMMEED